MSPEQRETLLKNLRFFAAAQSSTECRENYFRSCEAHGSEHAELVALVRKDYLDTFENIIV